MANILPFRRPKRTVRRQTGRRGWWCRPLTLLLLVLLVVAARSFGERATIERTGDRWTGDGRFAPCGGGRSTCVSDGDSFRIDGERYRLVGLDAPETGSPECAAERTRAFEARAALIGIFNEGPFTLEPHRDRPVDRYGRHLVVARRDGVDFSDRMIGAGMAQPYVGRRALYWC